MLVGSSPHKQKEESGEELSAAHRRGLLALGSDGFLWNRVQRVHLQPVLGPTATWPVVCLPSCATSLEGFV